MNLQTLKQKIKCDAYLNTFKTNRTVWILVILSGIIALSWDLKRSPNNKPSSSEGGPVVDTIIPRGYALIPIEVQNYEALDSVFGNYGIVTLYSVPESGQGQPKKLADRVKMLRAPQNPTQFGVLIRESESDTIAAHVGPVFVVMHNRTTESGGVEKARAAKAARFKIVEESE